MLVLAEVAQLEDVVPVLLQRGDRPIRTGLVVDIPGLAVDLPEAVGATLFDILRQRAGPFEIETQRLGALQIGLGNWVGR